MLILDIAGIRASMLPDVGGKAANLGELARSGLPVPPGFCLTTAAYRQALSGAGLEAVLAALKETPAAQLEDLNRLAARARSLVLDAGVPAGIAEAVRSAYQQLGENVPVAVRSSATAEDLAFASFAGQQDTFLNV
ncbi:PEP/pyruvate-binding domain-containing protein, partial [Paenarthrobacter sp. CM16]|uniref:PEP/pyruvate-binding domain-containing protein n=1 Tax=Paenarthrobacter sp. CM16 TaxID=2738447 RepID=UPI0035C6704C